MSQELTQNQRWLSRKYLAYEFLTNLFFVGAVWLYFYRLFISDQQVGILDGFAFAIGLIAEVPSGVLADRFGRDKLVKLGQFLAGSGLLIQAFGSSFVPFFVGQAIMMIGISFVSGADEALFFGKLNFDRNSTNWRKLVTRGSQVALIGLLFATIAGGWLHSVNPRIPWILTGLSFVGSVLLIWRIKDDRPEKAKQKFTAELAEHLRSIKSGFAEFRTSKLWLYVPIILTVQGLFYTAGWGLLRLVLLDRFHFEPFMGSLVIASSSLITVGILAIMHRHAENMSERRVITLISLAAASSLLLSLADIGAWGYFVIFALYAGEHVLYPFMSEVLNNRASEEQRATVLSVASFLRTLPYVALAPIIGYLNTHDQLEYFLIAWTILIFVAILLYLTLKKNDAYVSLVKQEVEIEKRVPEIATGK
jgi:MFS family permease